MAGQISHIDHNCERSDGVCGFTLFSGDVPIHVYFDMGLDYEDCTDPAAVQHLGSFRQWDNVVVVGGQIEPGEITVCGSAEYSVELVPPE